MKNLTLMGCPQQGYQIQRQMTGPYVNSYLLVDLSSRKAAIFDPGGPVDSLLATIAKEHLELQYIFFTHGHIDHVLGLPPLRSRFPQAKVAISKEDYEDMLVQVDWINTHLSPQEIAEWKADPEVAKMFLFDAATFRKPDIELKGGQTYALGRTKIKTILCPGHSRGSIVFSVGNALFTGDLLMRGDVGRADFQNSSPEAMIKSVRGLYASFPDSTLVYPGHGPATTIGREKTQNPKISADKSNL
jgi:hydroxyacylglutathione hydrolase